MLSIRYVQYLGCILLFLATVTGTIRTAYAQEDANVYLQIPLSWSEGIFPVDPKDPYIIQRISHPDDPDYHLFLLCSNAQTTGDHGNIERQFFDWRDDFSITPVNYKNDFDQQRHLSLQNMASFLDEFDHDDLPKYHKEHLQYKIDQAYWSQHYYQDKNGFACIPFLYDAFVKIDDSADWIFRLDEQYGNQALIAEIAVSFLAGGIVSGLVFKGLMYGIGLTTAAESTALHWTAFGLSFLAAMPAVGLVRNTLGSHSIEPENMWEDIALGEKNLPNRNWNVNGANYTTPNIIKGTGSEKNFSDGKVFLEQTVEVSSIAAKLRCFFGTFACLPRGQEAMTITTIEEGDSTACDWKRLPKIEIAYQSWKDVSDVD
ncbi:MAG: hypothetical protein R3A45_07760 [Bdellovibrionota bacterium]